MTLNDLERRSSPYFAFFSPNLIDFPADYITLIEDRPIMSVKYSLPVQVFTFGENYNATCSAVSLCMPNIIKIRQCFLKLQLKMLGMFFLRHTENVF